MVQNRITVGALVLSLWIGSCTTSPPPEVEPVPSWIVGDYQGTGTLWIPGEPAREGAVAFSFGAGGYRVQGPIELAPSSAGRYEVGETLILVDDGAHTNHFDTSPLLNGHFLYRRSGVGLVLEQLDQRGRRRRFVLNRVAPAQATGGD